MDFSLAFSYSSKMSPWEGPVPETTQVTTAEDEILYGIDPLLNDFLSPGSYLSDYDAVSSAGGIVTKSGGTLNYDPPKDFNGVDTFSYKVTDAALLSRWGTVEVTVTPVDDGVPVLGDLEYNVPFGSTVTIEFDIRSTDPASITSYDSITSLGGTVDSNFLYTPPVLGNTEVVTDVMNYTVTDNTGDATDGIVYFNVRPEFFTQFTFSLPISALEGEKTNVLPAYIPLGL